MPLLMKKILFLKCAEDKETRDMIRRFGGLDPLVNLLAIKENKHLLAAATGAIWKCSISKENVKRFQELRSIESLVTLLQDPTEEVFYSFIAIWVFCKNRPNWIQSFSNFGFSA
jgi:hypothetical protein